MKAIVTIRTWKPAAEPTTWKKFDIASEAKYKFEAESLEKAELKVLTSFRADQVIGFNIKMENGDFTCQAVKDYWFEDEASNKEIFGTVSPSDEQIRDHLIKCIKKRMQDEEDVKAGRKRWVEDPYSGDMYLEVVKEVR